MTAWAPQVSGFDGSECQAVCWSPALGLFAVAGTGNESIATSPDGVTWTDQPSAIGGGGDAIVWADALGLFVASGADGGSDVQIVTSPDGVVWTAQVTPWDEFATHTVLGLAWSSDLGLLVAVGESFTSGETVMTSPDGVNWTAQSTPFDSPSSGARGLGVCWSPELGLFIVAGNSGASDATVMTSPDGTAWTAQTTPFDGGQAWGSCWSSRLGLAVVVGTDPNFDGTVLMTSPDAIVWTTQSTPYGDGGGGQAYGVFDCGSALVMVGDPDDFGGTATSAIAQSADGLIWTSDTSPFDGDPGGRGKAVTYSPELSLAVAVGLNSLPGGEAIATAPFVTPTPPGPVPRVFADLPWRVFITDIHMRTISILDHRATGRQFLYTLNGPAMATGQVASDDAEINLPFPNADSPANLTHDRRLLFAMRREQGADPPYVCRFGGIVQQFEDEGADAPTSRYTAFDPWQYMMSRPIRDPNTGALPGEAGITFPAGTRASEIAVVFLENTEAVDGETHIYTDGTNFPLVEPTDPLPSEITFDAGLSVGEAWQQLCETGTIDILLPPMYDPDLAPKVCQFACMPRAGSTRHNIVMAWDRPGRSLMSVNRLVDGTRLANRVKFFTGQGAGAPLQSDAASIAAYGEYWAQQFFPGSANRDIVELLALAELLIRRNGSRSLTAEPAPERTELVLRDYNLGDYVPVWASRNLREVIGVNYDTFDPDNPGASGYQRIQVIPVDVDDNGVARVRGLVLSGIDVRQAAQPPVSMNVMKADAAEGDAWARPTGSGPGITGNNWLTFGLAYAADALAFWESLSGPSDGSGYFGSLYRAGESNSLYIADDSGTPRWFDVNGNSFDGPLTAGVWHLIELHFDSAGVSNNAHIYIDGALVDTLTSLGGGITDIYMGQKVTGTNDAAAIGYIRDVKWGTTRGGSEIFADDFASGDFSAWAETMGAVSVVSDPFA